MDFLPILTRMHGKKYEQQCLPKLTLEFTDVKPYNNAGKVMVPIRKLSEGLGANVIYDGAKKEIRIQKDGGEKQIIINKDPVVLQDGRCLVHIRFLAESLGYHVEWLGEYNAVIVTLP